MGIQLDNVTLSYNRHPAIHHVTLNIEYGSMLAILGPNGGGKSTLLKGLAKLKEVDEGSILFSDPTKKVAYLSQLNQFDFSFPLRAIDVVLMGSLAHKGLWSKIDSTDISKAKIALGQVGLESCEKKSLNQLSPGQLQRVLFARLIIQNANILLLDEPFNAIDEKTTHELCQLLRIWHQEKKTIICVLHQPDLALKYFPQSLILSKKLSAFGNTQEVLNNQTIFTTLPPDQPEIPIEPTKEICKL
jgi:zinc/manganese transport system ATP-binding protein